MKRLFSDMLSVAKKYANIPTLSLLCSLAAVVFAEVYLGVGCPIHFMTGINCPGCGMSRALFCVLRLDLPRAFAFHPLWWLLPVLAVFWFLRESSRISRRTFDRFLAVFSALFILVYLIRLLNPTEMLVCARPTEGWIFRTLARLFAPQGG